MIAALESVHRLTVDDVHTMVESGVLGGEDRVELVDGILLDIRPSGAFHSAVVARLGEHFVRAATPEWWVWVQDTLYVADGFLSPDLMIVPRTATFQSHHHALLVIEVSYSTQRRDEAKVPLYAGAGVNEYWQVDVEAEEAIVHRRPEGGAYAESVRYGPGDMLAPLVDAPAVELSALLRH